MNRCAAAARATTAARVAAAATPLLLLLLLLAPLLLLRQPHGDDLKLGDALLSDLFDARILVWEGLQAGLEIFAAQLVRLEYIGLRPQ